jgi:hypothetical protein
MVACRPVAVAAGLDRLGQPGRPGRPVQVARAGLQLDRGKKTGQYRGEQLRLGRQARSGVQDLARQAPLDREDGAGCVPRAEVLRRGIASLAQAADQADQAPLAGQGQLATRDQLDHQVVASRGHGKSRTGLSAQPLTADHHPVHASQPRHRGQQLPIEPSRLKTSHRDHPLGRPGAAAFPDQHDRQTLAQAYGQARSGDRLEPP